MAYVVIDAVIDLEWTRKMFTDKSDDFFIKPAAIADTTWQVVHQERSGCRFMSRSGRSAKSGEHGSGARRECAEWLCGLRRTRLGVGSRLLER